MTLKTMISIATFKNHFYDCIAHFMVQYQCDSRLVTDIAIKKLIIELIMRHCKEKKLITQRVGQTHERRRKLNVYTAMLAPKW